MRQLISHLWQSVSVGTLELSREDGDVLRRGLDFEVESKSGLLVLMRLPPCWGGSSHHDLLGTLPHSRHRPLSSSRLVEVSVCAHTRALKQTWAHFMHSLWRVFIWLSSFHCLLHPIGWNVVGHAVCILLSLAIEKEGRLDQRQEADKEGGQGLQCSQTAAVRVPAFLEWASWPSTPGEPDSVLHRHLKAPWGAVVQSATGWKTGSFMSVYFRFVWCCYVWSGRSWCLPLQCVAWWQFFVVVNHPRHLTMIVTKTTFASVRFESSPTELPNISAWH